MTNFMCGNYLETLQTTLERIYSIRVNNKCIVDRNGTGIIIRWIIGNYRDIFVADYSLFWSMEYRQVMMLVSCMMILWWLLGNCGMSRGLGWALAWNLGKYSQFSQLICYLYPHCVEEMNHTWWLIWEWKTVYKQCEQLIANWACGNKQRITAKVFLTAEHVGRADLLRYRSLLRGIRLLSQSRKTIVICGN